MKQTAKNLDLLIRAIEVLIVSRHAHVAIELIEEATASNESCIEADPFKDIKHGLFLVSLYLICNMEPYHALKELGDARARLKKYAVHKALIANRLRKRIRCSAIDVGDLDCLPELCFEKIAEFLCVD